MQENTSLAPPQWVESGAIDSKGLDLLALRAPAMRIGNELLDGITTITPSVRYLSFVAWITQRYWERGGQDSRRGYLEFARRLEAVIVLSNLVVDRDTLGLIGSDTAATDLEGDEIPLAIQVRALGTNVYAGPAEHLRILESRPDAEVPHLTLLRGLPLAREIDEAVSHTALGRRLANEELPETASRADLEEFGQHVRVRVFPSQEKAVLLNALLPTEPTTPMEFRRLATYGSFLACAEGGQPQRDFRRLINEAVRAERGLPPTLTPILDGWTRYLVRDMLAVVHEYAFHAILSALPHGDGNAPEYVGPVAAIRTSLEERTAIETAFEELGLTQGRETWDSLPFAELDRRITALTSTEEHFENGLRKWKGGLQEPDLIRVVRQTGAAAPALLPVAWLLAERRTQPGIHSKMKEFRQLSHEGISRIGLEQMIFPKLTAFRGKPVACMEAAAELGAMTVEQHLRTVWTRLAGEGKDVSVLLTDGNRWAFRKNFAPGQVDSRLTQVSNWLTQLGLITKEGLTPEGETQLASILVTLANGGVQ